jgi:putative transcriptional regulator
MISLAPAFLVSMPQLVDRNFAQTVILLCSHSEQDGAFGLVVNRPATTRGRLMVSLDPPINTDREIEIWLGGPVDPQCSWMLVARAPDDPPGEFSEIAAGDRPIAEGLYLSTSPKLLRRLLEPAPPPRARLIVGYSGWGPGQLEDELADSAWLVSKVDTGLIFDTPPDQMWTTALRRLGTDPAALQSGRGVH